MHANIISDSILSIPYKDTFVYTRKKYLPKRPNNMVCYIGIIKTEYKLLD